jgi:hypothetical protein
VHLIGFHYKDSLIIVIAFGHQHWICLVWSVTAVVSTICYMNDFVKFAFEITDTFWQLWEKVKVFWDVTLWHWVFPDILNGHGAFLTEEWRFLVDCWTPAGEGTVFPHSVKNHRHIPESDSSATLPENLKTCTFDRGMWVYPVMCGTWLSTCFSKVRASKDTGMVDEWQQSSLGVKVRSWGLWWLTCLCPLSAQWSLLWLDVGHWEYLFNKYSLKSHHINPLMM